MNVMKNIINEKLIMAVCIIIVSLLINKLFKLAMSAKIKKSNSKDKRLTYIKLICNIFKYCIAICTLLLILKIYGVNITSIVAGLSIISVVVGLGLQETLKDMLVGVDIIFDEYFAVGDVVKINDIEGKVLVIGLKTTKIKDINTQDVYAVSNRNIKSAFNISRQLDIDIPISYSEKTEKIEKMIDIIMVQIRNLNKVYSVEYRGINQFGESAVFYKIRIMCEQETKPQTKRDALRIIKLSLDQNNINIPFNQLDVNIKNH